MKLSLALRSHSGEITLPGLVGAWMLVAFSVKLPAGGGQFGAAFFSDLNEHILGYVSPACMGEGRQLWPIILARQHLIHAVYFVFTLGNHGAFS